MAVTAMPLIDAKYAVDSTTTEYTVPTGKRTIIDKFTATNVDGSSRTISVYLIPSGDTASASNQIIKDLSISAGATDDIEELKNQVLATGDKIAVSASAASVVTIRVSGRECT